MNSYDTSEKIETKLPEVIVQDSLKDAIETGINICKPVVTRIKGILYISINGNNKLLTKSRLEVFLNNNIVFRKVVVLDDGRRYFPIISPSTYRILSCIYQSLKDDDSIKEKEVILNTENLYKFLLFCKSKYGNEKFTASYIFNNTPYKKLPNNLINSNSVIQLGRELNKFVDISIDNLILRKEMESKMSYYYIEEINV